MSERPDDALNDPGLRALADSLRGLAPRLDGFDRERLLFRAGQAAAPGRRLWPLLTAASTLAAAVLGGLLWLRPEPLPRTVERIVYLPSPEPKPSPQPPTDGGQAKPQSSEAVAANTEDSGPRPRYLRIQEQVLRRGLDGLPDPSPPSQPEAPLTLDSLLHSF